jgi:hypothetical integral membrane protein (TIGR02206 family)
VLAHAPTLALAPGARSGEDFINFSATHFITLAACLLVMIVLAIAGRRCRQTPAGRCVHWTWFAITLGVQLANVIFFAFVLRLPADDAHPQPYTDWSVALPLQICDLAGLLLIPALLTRSRLLRTILYYWAIGLCTEAFITPVLGYGWRNIRFWLFWSSHVTIVATAIYFLAVEGYRPTWRDFGISTIVILLYGAIVIPLDIAFGFNYGFAGKDNDLGTTTILNYLGPWPLRILFMFLIVEAVSALLTVIWRRPHRSPSAHAEGVAESSRPGVAGARPERTR